MKEPRVLSVILELDSEQGSASIVVRDPFGRGRKVFVAGASSAADVSQALERLGLTGGFTQSTHAPHSLRPSIRPSATGAASDAAPASALSQGDRVAEVGLAEELEKLAGAVLRGGLAGESSSTDEALDDLVELVRGRELDALARLVDSVEHAIEVRSATLLAIPLAAVGHAVEALRGPASELQAELCGPGPVGSSELTGLEMVEVGRTRQRGVLTVETRLLVEISTGELFREVACLGRGLSHGQTGRMLDVDLAQRLPSTEPARLLIHQYEMRPLATRAQLDRALVAARTDMSLPPGVRQDPLRLVYQPLAVLLAPARVVVERGECLHLEDDAGRRLAVIAPTAGASTEALADVVDQHPETRITLAGSMVVDSSGIGFLPWTAWLLEASGPRAVQLDL
jgi:hypothetical protein